MDLTIYMLGVRDALVASGRMNAVDATATAVNMLKVSNVSEMPGLYAKMSFVSDDVQASLAETIVIYD